MAASLTRCKAKRGSTRSEGRPDQERRRSQDPRRKCSGSRSQMPIWLPEILSAKAWRTCRSKLLGSAETARRFLRVRWVWTNWGGLAGLRV